MLNLFTKFNLIKRIYYKYFEKKIMEEDRTYLGVPYKISMIKLEGKFFIAADVMGKRYYRDSNSNYRMLPNTYRSLYIDASYDDESSAMIGLDFFKNLVESNISSHLHDKDMNKRLAKARRYL